MTDHQQREAARKFVEYWQGKGYEKGQCQPFWLALLRDVFGIEKPEQFISFEDQVHLDHTSFIDGYILATHTMIEQKSLDKDLRKAILQSDKSLLTPFQQAKRYSADLPYSLRPRWVVTCNFRSFLVYDMEAPNGEPEEILLENLETEYYRLQFLVDTGSEHLQKEFEVSIQAGEIIGKIYDEFLKEYQHPDDPETLKSLNILCVRLVFCLYAEDAGIFGHRDMFFNYLSQFPPGRGDMRRALIDLFRILNTPAEERDPYENPELLEFPYCNGGLFADTHIEIPRFNDRIATLLLQNASKDFDWSQISPTIFGAVFESTLNPDTRRSGGMHYTSIENIHKVIDPLFLDELKEEFEHIKREPVERTRMQHCKAFQEKLASLTFLDPACGSGNFLTETYMSLRRLENAVIVEMNQGQGLLGFDEVNPIKVDIHQFYGIEINDFAVATATTALWIAEAQMMKETESIIQRDLDLLPLKTYKNITEGNALRIDWNTVVPPEKLNYILGNPPFVGARWMNKEQKDDVLSIFGKDWQGVGDLDYVCCWYKKAADIINNTKIKCAFVSTNSITQGGAVANLWKPLMSDLCMHIDFAWRTFRWDSESTQKAHVHCVIVGFSDACCSPHKKARLFESSGQENICENINGYLVPANNVFIEKSMKPISDVPMINLGGQAIDDGNLVLTEEEKDELIKESPIIYKYIRPYMMGKDFIERKTRYCLWLKHANPTDIRQSKPLMERIERVRTFRSSSNRKSTLKAAETPTLFAQPIECENDYVAIPKVSSERRRYIPMDYLSKEIIPGDKVFVMQNAGLYHFGILTSNVHMAWMRAVCGRLKSDYSYSNTIVYNNFPWPSPTEEQQQRIEQTAQAILDARALYPDCSMADLYDEVTMPPELRRAHQDNDRAVMAAYGFPVKGFTESDCVARLFDMYQRLHP